MPEWFGTVSERLRAPANAIFATLAIGVVFLFLLVALLGHAGGAYDFDSLRAAGSAAPALAGVAFLLALAGIAFLPLASQLWRGFELTTAVATAGSLLPLFRRGLDSFYQAYSAHWDLWFAVVLAFCLVGLVASSRRLGWRTTGWLLGWGIGIPLGAYAA